MIKTLVFASVLSLNSTFQSKTTMVDVSLYNNLFFIEDDIHYFSVDNKFVLQEENIIVFIGKENKEVLFCGRFLNALHQPVARKRSYSPQKFKLGGVM